MASQIRFLKETAVETHRFSGVITYDRYFRVPLNYNVSPDHADIKAEPLLKKETNMEKDKLTIFARHVILAKNHEKMDSLPWILYLQGGPGFEAPTVTRASSWFGPVLEKYQLLLLDQRWVQNLRSSTSILKYDYYKRNRIIIFDNNSDIDRY